MGNCSSTSNCNPCGPDFSAINHLATKASSFARQANTYAVDAANAATDAERYWLEFNTLYLGAFSSAPTIDNQGGQLKDGALYYNTISKQLFAYDLTTTTWVVVNFSELTNFVATSSTAPRNLVSRFSDFVNVLDFGAVADYVTPSGTDNLAAFNAAIASVSTNGGIVYFPKGRYFCNGTINLPRGVVMVGNGTIDNNGGTQIIFGNPTGSCIRVTGSHCGINNINIVSNTFRYTSTRITGTNYSILGLNREDQNYGIWVEPPDAPTGNTEFFQVKNVWITNQPNDALVIASRSYVHTINQLGVFNSSGHSVVISDGTYTGRTFLAIPIGVHLSECILTRSRGHGLLCGGPDQGVPPARIIIENCDCYACGTDTSIMYPDSNGQYYIHFLYADQSTIKNSAINGRDVLGTLLCGGRQININNNRYLNSTQPIRLEGDLGSSVRATQGVKIFGLSVISPPSTVTNAVSIGSNATNISVDASVTGGYINPATPGLASIIYATDKTIFNESILSGKTVDDDNTVGSRITSGIVSSTRDGNVSGIFGRQTSNGDLIFFRRSGSTVGKIAVDTNSALFYTMTNVYWESGAFGNPNGNITASPGSMYTSTVGGAGNTLWVKESGTGNTGWVNK